MGWIFSPFLSRVALSPDHKICENFLKNKCEDTVLLKSGFSLADLLSGSYGTSTGYWHLKCTVFTIYIWILVTSCTQFEYQWKNNRIRPTEPYPTLNNDPSKKKLAFPQFFICCSITSTKLFQKLNPDPVKSPKNATTWNSLFSY